MYFNMYILYIGCTFHFLVHMLVNLCNQTVCEKRKVAFELIVAHLQSDALIIKPSPFRIIMILILKRHQYFKIIYS